MTVLAALATGVAVWLVAEWIAGRPVRLGRRPARARARARRRGVDRQVWLSQAGAAVTPRQFWAVCVAASVVTGLVLWAITRTLVVAAVPAAGAGALPYAYWSVERRRRANARFEAWPDALRLVSGGLQAGIANLHDGLVELSVSGPQALRAPFARYARLVSRGVSERAALEAIRTELADPVSDPVLLCLAMAATEGTSVAVNVLRDLTSQITGDLELAEKIRTVQTQSRIAGWAVFVLPYALLVFLSATNRFYRQFYATSEGLLVVLLGAALSMIGIVVLRRLAQPVAANERVFVREGTTPGRREAWR